MILNSLYDPQMTSELMRRRREAAMDGDSMADGAAAASAETAAASAGIADAGAEEAASSGQKAAAGERAADAADSAGAREGETGKGLELVGQELVPASQALALRTPEGLDKGQQSSVANTSKSPSAVAELSSKGQKSKEGSSKGKEETPNQPETERNDVLATPNGPPVSLGPQSFVTPEGQVQNMLPFFSLEQSARLREIHHQQPFASPPSSWSPPAVGERGHGGGAGQVVPNWFTALLQSVGTAQGEQDVRQREYMWRMQVEQTLEQLRVQLRASQMENQRLRQECQELMEALEKKELLRTGRPAS